MIFSNTSAPQLNDNAKKVIVLPLGAIEQHGPHLPVGTDTHIVTALSQALQQALPEDVVLCPSLPFGSSHHHLDFGGTISLTPALYTAVVVELVQSLLQDGFQRIVLLNGHGGNITPVRQALSILSNQINGDQSPNIVLATYWELAGKAFAGAAPMESPALSHACEYETSLILHLYPEQVRREHIKRSQRPASNGYIPWEDDEPYRGISLVKPTAYISDNGASGEPQLGTKEKGEHLFKEALQALVGFVSEFKNWPLMDKLKR